jgi:hypothetical protein
MAESTKTFTVSTYSLTENGGNANTSSGQQAGGTGTFADPITAAAGTGGPAQGSILYDSALQKYFIVEDTSSDTQLVYWIGNATAAQSTNIWNAVHGQRSVIVNDKFHQPLWCWWKPASTATCGDDTDLCRQHIHAGAERRNDQYVQRCCRWRQWLVC